MSATVELDPTRTVRALLRFVHEPEFEDMGAAFAILGDDMRDTLLRKFQREDGRHLRPDSILWGDFATFVRRSLRDRLPPSFAYEAVTGWEAGMALVSFVTADGQPFYAFRVQRVEPHPDAPEFAWRVHSFTPVAQPVAA